jgi:outer membrane protein OmpA-like peptidoglycan-associated protein
MDSKNQIALSHNYSFLNPSTMFNRTLKKTLHFSILFFFTALFMSKMSFAQTGSTLKKVSCDCDSAIKLKIFKRAIYGFTQAPEGFGKIQEIRAKSNTSKTAFEKEHHTAWYLLEFNISGELVFEITPKDKKDDYDFLLYPYKDSTTCADILAERTKPVRSNLSRNDTSNLSITGLSINAKNEFNGKGVGVQFSKSIGVKADEKYVLVLDNVYDAGSGHKLSFAFIKEVSIAGQVINDEGKPLVAEVTLYDNKGLEVNKTNSDAKGEYKMTTTIVENTDYSLNFTADNSFVGAEIINTKNLKDSNRFVNIKTILPQLKKGKKYKVGNLNFWGGSPNLIPRSTPSLISLYHLMRKNKNMKIQIEGHVNGVELNGAKITSQTKEGYQLLSDQRTETVFNYLKEKGIDEKRMSKIGYSDLYMLFPKPINEYEQEANRRVEIKVISLD